MTFEDLDLIEPIRKALVQEGYTTPTPIQSEAIPIVSQGYDLLGCAQTGTGKTAAFSIPIIQRLYLQKKKGYKRGIKALILTPTRELAIQIGESFAAYGRFAGLRHTVIFGGVGQGYFHLLRLAQDRTCQALDLRGHGSGEEQGLAFLGQ